MAKETIYGLTFVLVLATVFGAIVVRKLNEPPSAIAATEEMGDLLPKSPAAEPLTTTGGVADDFPIVNTRQTPENNGTSTVPTGFDDFEPVDFAAMDKARRTPTPNSSGGGSRNSGRSYSAVESEFQPSTTSNPGPAGTAVAAEDPFDPFASPADPTSSRPVEPTEFTPVPTQAMAADDDPFFPATPSRNQPVETVQSRSGSPANEFGSDPFGTDGGAEFGNMTAQTEPTESVPVQTLPTQDLTSRTIPEQGEPTAEKPEPFDPFASDPVPVATTQRDRMPIDVVEPEMAAPRTEFATNNSEPAGSDADAFDPFATAPSSDAMNGSSDTPSSGGVQLVPLDPVDQPVNQNVAVDEFSPVPRQPSEPNGFDDFSAPAGNSVSVAERPAGESMNDPFGADTNELPANSFEPVPQQTAANSPPSLSFGGEPEFDDTPAMTQNPAPTPAEFGDFGRTEPGEFRSPDFDAPSGQRTAARPSGETGTGIADWNTQARSQTGNTAGRREPTSDIYVVQPNENFWTISRNAYGTARYFMALARYNEQNVEDPRRMRPGTKVMTPPTQTLIEAFPDMFPQGAPSSIRLVGATSDNGPGEFFIDAEGVPRYRIGTEDTLSAIAQDHLGRSSRWLQIYEMNRDSLRSPDDLKIGTVLRLPADASSVQLIRR